MDPMPSEQTQRRRSERKPHNVPITLLGKMSGLEYTEPAHTYNLSEHGLGVLTDNAVDPARKIEAGQILYVMGLDDYGTGYCRVVWSKAGERWDAPTWAGLQFIN